jgi:hypothetical protein
MTGRKWGVCAPVRGCLNWPVKAQTVTVSILFEVDIVRDP